MSRDMGGNKSQEREEGARGRGSVESGIMKNERTRYSQAASSEWQDSFIRERVL